MCQVHPECAQTLHDVSSAIQRLLGGAAHARRELFERFPQWGSPRLAAHRIRALRGRSGPLAAGGQRPGAAARGLRGILVRTGAAPLATTARPLGVQATGRWRCLAHLRRPLGAHCAALARLNGRPRGPFAPVQRNAAPVSSVGRRAPIDR